MDYNDLWRIYDNAESITTEWMEVALTGTAPDGRTVTETYGDYFGGAEGKNNDPFSMKPYLVFERPPKQKAYLKPDVIRYMPNAEPKALYLRGLWTPKEGTVVAVTAGDRPILVLGTTPKGGRIACVLATPFGEAARGETAFWDAPAWNQLMQNTVQWLVRR